MPTVGAVRIGIAALTFAALPTCALAALSASSRIGPTGAGPIIIGTTPAQAKATGTRFTESRPAPGSSCYYLRPRAPQGLTFLVESGTIRRVEASDPAIRTTDGLRVGDSLAKIRALYGPRAIVEPAKYDPHGQTVTIAPRPGGDAKYRTVFELRNGSIRAIRAGALPQVFYVEGCS